jgi:hypothetical protein
MKCLLFLLLALPAGAQVTGGSVAVFFSGSAGTPQVVGGMVGVSVLQDGAFPAGFTSTVGIASFASTINTQMGNLSAFVVLPAPAAGSHSYCLTTKSMSGNFNLDTTNMQAQFGVKEMK